MSSDDYRSESLETYKSSSEDARYGSESDQGTDQLFPLGEVEKEIEDEQFDDFKTYVEVLVEVGKKALKPLQLTDCYTSDHPSMYLEILPKVIFETVETETGIEEVDFPKPIFRLTIDQGTFATVEHASSHAQTQRNKLLNSWCQYEPRLYSDEDCTSIVKSDSFNSFLKTAEKGVFESLVQNKVADSFFWELKSLHGEESTTESYKESALVMKSSFVCYEGEQEQTINYIDWHPLLKDIFIVSTLRNKKFEERISDSIKAQDPSYTFYVWSCQNQYLPKIFLEYFDDITVLKFNPTLPDVVVGSSLSGLLVLWNLAKENKLEDNNYLNFTPLLHHSAISHPDHNHMGRINDFVWIPVHFEISTRGNVKISSSKHSYQLATCGSDGIIKFWDLRGSSQHKPGLSAAKMFRQLDGKWEPFHTVVMQLEDKCFSITKLVFRESSKTVKLDLEEKSPEEKPEKDTEQLSTEFYAGCDDGEIFCGNFKLYRDDGGKFVAHPPQLFKSPHNGSVTAIVLSPFICDIFLSTGCRTVCVWKHEIKETPIYCRNMHTYITSAEWSNTRPALFILGYEDGTIEIWDLLHSIYEPFLIHFVSTTSISAISVQSLTEDEHVVAVGDSQGTVYVLNLPYYLYTPIDNELLLMTEFVEKESSRMQSRFAGPENIPKPIESVKTEEKIQPLQDSLSDEVIQKNYEEFLELEERLLRHLGYTKGSQEKIG